MIYFIESQGMVKIGYSNDPKRRLQMLSTGCPTECTLLAICEGDEQEEARVHERFRHLRSRGEWFNFGDDLRQFIELHAVPWVQQRRTSFDHPLAAFISKSGETMTAFAKRTSTSRMTLYRLMKGEQNATIDLLRRISAATNGEVVVTDFIEAEAAQ